MIVFGKLTEISLSYKHGMIILCMPAHFLSQKDPDLCFDTLFYQHIISCKLGTSALVKRFFPNYDS